MRNEKMRGKYGKNTMCFTPLSVVYKVNKGN